MCCFISTFSIYFPTFILVFFYLKSYFLPTFSHSYAVQPSNVHCRPPCGFLYHVDTVLSMMSFVFFSGFPIIWGRRNGFGCLFSTLSCPVCPPLLTSHIPYIFYYAFPPGCLSFSLYVSCMLLVHLTFFLARALCPFS